MDKVSEKVDEVKKRDVQSQFSTGETMDGAILAHNLQRIIQVCWYYIPMIYPSIENYNFFAFCAGEWSNEEATFRKK